MSHLLDIASLDRHQLESYLELTESFVEVQQRTIPKVPVLRGRTVVLAFFEDSTRTRMSFDLAARRLSADVVNFSVSTSSTKKGESLRDTIETISAMGVDAIVIRHRSSGAPARITRWTDAAVVNAGDGWHQHPTQALLDSYTLTRHFQSLDGRTIAICGDVNHSRVARSNIEAFTTLGAEVVVVGPRTLMPPHLDQWGVRYEPRIDALLGDLDAVYLLRIQQERLGAPLFPTTREYRALYGLTVERAARLSPDAVIMHPGPVNRGVEVDPEVLDDRRARILDQVAAGIPTRMAVLYQLLGPGRFTTDGADDDIGTDTDTDTDTDTETRTDFETETDTEKVAAEVAL